MKYKRILLKISGEALLGEQQENNLGEIFASILLGTFSQFINQTDADAMREQLFKLKNSNDSFEKDSIQQQLIQLSNKYTLLIHIFLFKVIGDSSSNPQTAARAVCVYDEMMNALNNHNIAEVNELIQANDDLLQQVQNADGIDLHKGLV